MNLTNDFKQKVLDELMQVRNNFTGSDNAFSTQWNINKSVLSRLKHGEIEGLLKDSQWLNIGRILNVNLCERKWNTARTDVFTTIEQDIAFCRENSKARICVDDCGIGKTYTAKYLARTLTNCFYVDASQCKSKQLFIRTIAQTIGVETKGRLADVKENIKYYIKMLPQPIIIIDEAGDLSYEAFLELKEFWNATENACGWYMMGADGLRNKIERGINCKKVGYSEIFSRYSEKYTRVVPVNTHERQGFYKKLITDVLSVNCEDNELIQKTVARCLGNDTHGVIGGLRRAESLLLLNKKS